MTITNAAFRRAEAILTAAKIEGADALMSVVALALETMAPPPHPGDAGISDPITIRVAALAERLGWTPATIDTSLLQASEEIRAGLGFGLFSHDFAEGEEAGAYTSTTTPIWVRLANQLTAILRGTVVSPFARHDPQTLVLDSTSMAALDLIACCSESGGALLLREAETAGDRETELRGVAATIANNPRVVGNVVMAGPASTVEDRVSPAAAIVGAVLHEAGALVLTDPLFDPPGGGLVDDEDPFDENNQPSRQPAAVWQASTSGARALTLLPHVPIAVVVPVARNIMLAPSAATAFVTALGPLRRDRVAAAASIHTLTAGRLSEAVVERLVDLWDARSDRAQTSLGAVDRMIDGPTTLSPRQRMKRRALMRGDDAKIDATAFSAVAEAMVVGLAPHVWAPIKRQDKAPASRFCRELFVSEPHESLLFSQQLREIPGVRILLSGESGSGIEGWHVAGMRVCIWHRSISVKYLCYSTMTCFSTKDAMICLYHL